MAKTAKGSVKHRKRCLGMWNAFTRWLKENHSFEKAEDFLQFYLDEAKRWARLARSLLQHLCTRLRRASK